MNKNPIQNRLKQSKPARQAKQAFRTFQEFTRLEASGGIILMVTAVIALIWANSAWADFYFDLWHTPLAIQVGTGTLSHDLHWWINEALMVIFFFVIGLEIKREVLAGELSSVRQAALPFAAAIGGMLLPAGIYALLNAGTPGLRGWGIPMATDIAFALGVMALFGSRLPLSLKIFLTALAIVDDLGAVLVIALFYTGEVAWLYVALAAAILVLLVLANLFGIRSTLFYALFGIGLWLAFLQSGLHATLAGVLLAMTIPASAKINAPNFLQRARAQLADFERAGETDNRLLGEHQQEALIWLEDSVERVQTPLQRLEHNLHPWVTYAIIPLFALANAGVAVQMSDLSLLWQDRVTLGVIAGLLVGKQLGVFLAAWLVVKARLADLPKGVTWKHIYATGWLAGIGFTMSLFITNLAFVDADRIAAAKIGILVASLVAGLVGYVLLRLSVPPRTDS